MTTKNTLFDQPTEITDAMMAFPADISSVMPDYNDIPDEFKRQSSPWVKWQQGWFFYGLKQMPTPKAGIDLDAAMRHLVSIQRSNELKHEHKESAVAFLASKWFESV